MSAEPPPWVVEPNRCYGCMAKQEAEDLVPEKERRGIHFWFRRPRKGEFE